ncbi:hypothetical protein LPJ53_006052 [Coemansia erecta]|uniref:VPS9 domain-containing protein n=1 Tax=Coemansia erecta TaxID=147472 RepID=A0A9W7XUA2_9FUNG|nr:hypothetical protein LPJ53_006052 [Coemansia erecta]
MFSRNSFFRQSARGSDPLAGDAGEEATEAEVVGALNRLELAADDDVASRASGSHARLRDMGAEGAAAAGRSGSRGFPSTGFSRARRAAPGVRSVSAASDKAAAGVVAVPATTEAAQAADDTPEAPQAAPEAAKDTPQATKDTPQAAGDTPGDTEDTTDPAALLPAGSLGRRLWQHVQASPSASDMRTLLADGGPNALLLLPQTPSPTADLGSALDDHVLFTEHAAGADAATKFATSSGIHGRVAGTLVRALGVLPPMEQLMLRVGRTDAPRATLFDMLEGEDGSEEDGGDEGCRAVELRVARWAEMALPDGRRVHVAVTGGRLDRRLVADWSVTGLSAHVQAALDRTLASRVPSAPPPSLSASVRVCVEKIMQLVHAATGDQQTADAWQALAAELYDTLLAMLDALEEESSVCGDAEQRRRTCAALVDAVEMRVVDAVYLRVFAPASAADRLADERFEQRAAALRRGGLTPGLLGVGDRAAQPPRLLALACAAAGERLAEMDAVRAPAAKLQRVVDAHRVLVAHIDGAQASLSADSLLPLMIYALVRMPPAQVVANLRFVQRWRTRALLAAHLDYCLTNALAAVEYVVAGGGDDVAAKADGALGPRVPALRALQGLLAGDVVQGVADGGRKVAVGVYDATVGRLIDSAGQHIFRAPWRVLPLAMHGAGSGASGAHEQEMQDALRLPDEPADDRLEGAAAVARLPRATLRNAPRPAVIERFLGMQPGDLTLNDVSLLLTSYKELASFIDK